MFLLLLRNPIVKDLQFGKAKHILTKLENTVKKDEDRIF